MLSKKFLNQFFTKKRTLYVGGGVFLCLKILPNIMFGIIAQWYSLRIALIVNGVHERKIYFAVQLGVNKLVL